MKNSPKGNYGIPNLEPIENDILDLFPNSSICLTLEEIIEALCEKYAGHMIATAMRALISKNELEYVEGKYRPKSTKQTVLDSPPDDNEDIDYYIQEQLSENNDLEFVVIKHPLTKNLYWSRPRFPTLEAAKEFIRNQRRLPIYHLVED